MLLPTRPGWKRNQILQIRCPTKMLLGIRGLARSDQKLSGEELHSLHSNYTWDYISLEDVPTGVNPIQFIRSIGLERPKAVRKELHSMHSNYTWDYISLEDVPTGVKPIQFNICLQDQSTSWGRNSSLYS